MTQAKRKSRLTRDAWLAGALRCVSRTARDPTIDAVAKELGVSKGSFYHHFKNRHEFIMAMVSYWDRTNTRIIGESLEQSGLTPEEQLWELLVTVDRHDFPRVDIAIRAWAAPHPEVRKLIAKTDSYRLALVRRMFEGMGFAGDELEARTRSFVTTVSVELGIFDNIPKSRRRKHLRALHRFYTAKSSFP